MDGKLDQLAPVPVVMCGLCEAGTTPAIQGCSCEADELACQDPVYRYKSTKFAYDKIILFAMILYLSPIPGLWMLQMQSKSVQRNG